MIRAIYIKAESQLLNPTLDADLIAGYYADDPEAARSAWGAEFRSDLSQFLPDEYLDKSIMRERLSLPREYQFQYAAFIDSSGGAHDRFVLALAHKDERSTLVLDKLEIVEPPFDFFEVVARFAVIMNAYGTRVATGDYYLAEMLPQAFAKHGICYQTSVLTKSQIFAQVLPLFSAGMIELLDVKSLHSEFRALERRPRGGLTGDMIEVPRNGFDDQANAAAGALVIAANQLNTGGYDVVNNVTHAIRDYDPLAAPVPIQPAPRHLTGLMAERFGEEFSRAIRDID